MKENFPIALFFFFWGGGLKKKKKSNAELCCQCIQCVTIYLCVNEFVCAFYCSHSCVTLCMLVTFFIVRMTYTYPCVNEFVCVPSIYILVRMSLCVPCIFLILV